LQNRRPQLLVRLISKGRLYHFDTAAVNNAAGAVFQNQSQSQSQSHGVPFWTQLLVADSQGDFIKVTLWNRLATSMYHRLQPNQLLRIGNWRLKRRNDAKSCELTLNPYNPSGRIQVLSEPKLRHHLMSQQGIHEDSVDDHLPKSHVFIPRSIAQIQHTPHHTHIDVIGVLVYCSALYQSIQFTANVVDSSTATSSIATTKTFNNHQFYAFR
jgi:hypothetical protein